MDALKFYLLSSFAHHIRFRYFYPHSFLDYYLVIYPSLVLQRGHRYSKY